MIGRDLEREFDASVSNVLSVHLERLRGLGVAPATIARINLAYPALGIASGVIDRHGVFLPGDGGAHVVQPLVENGSLVDLIAWRPAAPTRWGLRTGLGWLLNADSAFATRWEGEVLNLHATPLDWLRADAQGVVVVDWAAPDLDSLRSFERIRCSNDMLGRTLRRALDRPRRLPRIETMEARRAA